MNWIKELDKIYTKLDDNNLDEIKNKIFNSQLSGGTGGEIFLLVATMLIKIKEENSELYKLIKEETDLILKYGKDIGYLS